ncbi:MAG: T9SS type A sorting domain-containing protein [Bacteroidales bacterium]|nr:T9SS type A sorting domain-containing protein [Bacteroidales bacterium]
MKRIFTLVVAVLCCAVVFAQANYSQHLMKRANRPMVSKKIEKPNKTREGEHWTCTFEESEAPYTTGQVSSSAANWELQTISDAGWQDYYWPLNSTNADSNGEVSETPTHWMMVDGGGNRPNAYDFDSYILFSGIDLSEAVSPQLGFYEYRMLWNIPETTEATVVEVSLNGGSTWTKHVVGCESTSEYGFWYRRVYIPEAAGQDNVMIRFRAKRNQTDIQNTFGVGYTAADFNVVWEIDDLVIEEAQAFDLVITDVRMNKGECNIYSDAAYAEQLGANQSKYYQYSPMFGMTPRSEWESPYMFASFNVAVENRGSEDVVPSVNITITGPNGEEIWTVDFEGESVGPYGRDTIDVIETVGQNIDKIFYFSEEQMQNIALGAYTVTYRVSTEAGEDPTPANNEASHPFYITEKAYCPATPNLTKTIGPNNWGDYTDGDEIVASFDYYTLPDEVLPIYVFISENTTPGTSIAANIYEYTGDSQNPWEITTSSSTYTIQETDPGTWIEIELETPLQLTEFDPSSSANAPDSKSIRVGIAFFENGDDNELHLGASNDMPNKGWICMWNMQNSQTSGIHAVNVNSDMNAPAICLGDPTVDPATTVATSEANEITMFPNPSNGIVNFTNVENATIEVYNMMGQVVASESNANANASIDLSGVANGNYIVRIVKDGEIATSKLNIVK